MLDGSAVLEGTYVDEGSYVLVWAVLDGSYVLDESVAEGSAVLEGLYVESPEVVDERLLVVEDKELAPVDEGTYWDTGLEVVSVLETLLVVGELVVVVLETVDAVVGTAGA